MRARAAGALPAGVVLLALVWLAFDAGGFFAGATATAAIAAALLLLLWITFADRPFDRLGAPLAVGLGAGALLAVWILLSATWSGAAARSLVEFDRALLYVLAVAFAGLTAGRSGPAPLVRAVALAAVGVATCALITRLLPDLWPTSAGPNADRLAYPLTYWNALGLVAALGVLGSVHLTASLDEPWWVRVLAAAGAPLAACALYFTFSRGAMAALVLGLAAYPVLARPGALPAGLLATVPATVAAVAAAYGADLLATEDFTSPAAVEEGRALAPVVGLAALAAVGIRLALVRTDDRVARGIRRLRPRPRVLAVAAVAAVGLLAAGAATAEVPDRLQRQVERFSQDTSIASTGDQRDRLREVNNNGRIDHWQVALEAFDRRPVTGEGAGTFPIAWARDRPSTFTTTEAHGLPQETLGELGLVGGVLLLLFLAGPAAGAVARLRGPTRTATGAALALFLMWGARSVIDWDWEMPAVTLAALVPLAAAAGRPDPAPGPPSPGRLPRVLLGLGCLVLILTPVSVARSQHHLDRAIAAFAEGDCPKTIDASIASARALNVRPEPFEYLGYCDVRLGRTDLAVKALESAVRRDPENWRVHYGLALVRAADGQDPRPALRRTRRLNPRAPLVRRTWKRFARLDTPKAWKRASGDATLPF